MLTDRGSASVQMTVPNVGMAEENRWSGKRRERRAHRKEGLVHQDAACDKIKKVCTQKGRMAGHQTRTSVATRTSLTPPSQS